jgi:hypothetical protein
MPSSIRKKLDAEIKPPIAHGLYSSTIRRIRRYVSRHVMNVNIIIGILTGLDLK